MPISNQQSTLRNLLWLAIPSLLVIAALWFDGLPWLRGNDEWRWPLRTTITPDRLVVAIGALALYVLIAAGWLRRFDRPTASRRNERLFLLFLTLAAPLIQLALAYGVSRVPLLDFFGPTVSVHNSGYFTTAVATPDLDQLLGHYPAIMPSLPIHAQSHPPGPIIAQWLSWQLFQAIGPAADSIALPLRTLQCHNPGLMALDNAQIASASLGMLLPVLGALAVWPLFAWGKRVVGERASALAAALFPIMPLFAMWPAQWDQIYPLLLLLGLYLAHIGLERGSWWRVFAAGVPLSIASFFSVGNFVLMAVVGLYGVAWLVTRRMRQAARRDEVTGTGNSASELASRLKPTWVNSSRFRSWALDTLGFGVLFALGCLSIWIVYAVIYHVNPLDVIATGSRLAFESTTGNRTYGAWLIGNPIDFAVFLGVPVVIALVIGLASQQVSAASDKGQPTSVGLKTLSVATFGTLIALLLSGIVRGEVGRLWMYFGPLVGLLAARPFTRHSLLVTHYSILLALLALQLFVMNTRWLVNDSFLDAPPERSANYQVPVPRYGAQYSFDHQVGLIGYDVHVADKHMDLTLNWQALAQPPHAYTVFVHVVDAAGRAVGQQDNMPVRDQLPTSCWRPGEYVSDPYTIKIADGARGPFTIEVGLYRLETGERLPLDDGSGSSARLIGP